MKLIALLMITVALFHQQQAYRRKAPSMTSIANYISPPHYQYNNYPPSPYSPWQRGPFVYYAGEFDNLQPFNVQADSNQEYSPSGDALLLSALLGDAQYGSGQKDRKYFGSPVSQQNDDLATESRLAATGGDNVVESINEQARQLQKQNRLLFLFGGNNGLLNLLQSTFTTYVNITTPAIQTCLPTSYFSGGRPAATCGRRRRDLAQILEFENEGLLRPSEPLSVEATAAPDLARERRDQGGKLESSLNDLMRLGLMERASNRLLFQNLFSPTTVTSYLFTSTVLQKTLVNFASASMLLCIPSNVALCT